MTLVFVMVASASAPAPPGVGVPEQTSGTPSNRGRRPGADVRHPSDRGRHLRPSYPLLDRRSRTSTTIPVARPSNPPG